MSDMNEEQLHAMVDARNLEEGEPLFVVQAAWDDISMWLIENRPVVETKMVTNPETGELEEFKVQEPWDWEAESDTIVLFGHPVYAQQWQELAPKEERDNYVDESMVLGPQGGARQMPDVYMEPDGVQVKF